jgi:Xaa-Pro aminopeptidase
MLTGRDRLARVVAALQETGLDGLVCTLPSNVLLLSGYWPVVGASVALANRDGRVVVLAPQDEQELASRGWAEVRTYKPGMGTMPAEAAGEPLAALLGDLGLARARLGHDGSDIYEPVTYATMYLFGPTIEAIVIGGAPEATLAPATAALSRLHAALTAEEVGQVRVACAIAAQAFAQGMAALRPGLPEFEVAMTFARTLTVEGLAREDTARAGGFMFCMSGPRSAQAGGAYAHTGARALRAGDLVLVHCNSYVDGYWTDITRTYCLGEPEARQRAMYGAVFAAREAALAALRPGVLAADADRAARDVIAAHGFGPYFTHGLGHNVGFAGAVTSRYPPHLSPTATDRLEPGMTFNIEPAIYIEGYGGMRHCDVITLGEQGPEVLTPFQAGPEELIIGT